ncbi:MAG: ATP-binding protein [Anaerolineae bacterium]
MENRPVSSSAVDWLISHLRWAWLIVALLLRLGSDVIGLSPLPNPFEFYILLGGGIVYNLILVGILTANGYRNWIATVAAILDTLLAIGFLLVSGGISGPMLPVMIFPVVTITLRLNIEGGLLTAAVLSLAYAISVFLPGQTLVLETLLQLGLNSLVLFGVSALSGFIFYRYVEARQSADQAELKRLRVANARAKAVYEMASTLSATLNYRRVLNSMIDLASMALNEAGTPRDDTTVGIVFLVDEDGPTDSLHVHASRNLPRPDERTRVVPEDGILRRVIYTAETVISNDLQNDPVARSFIALQNCQSAVCAPLRAGFDIYGAVLFASAQPNTYTQEHANLLTTFCSQAIIALQNAQLYADLEQEQQKLLEKDAEARHKLARDLHDGPTQAVSAIVMRLDFVRMLLRQEGDVDKAIDEIQKVEDIARRTTKELRTMLFTLRPVVLETQGLAAALEQFAERLRENDELNVRIDTGGYDGQLPTQTEGVIFAVVEEAIGNAKKHAQADQINIRIQLMNGSVITEVIDNGRGFDVNSVRASYDQRGSLGLLNMDERAKMVGGRCHITSAPGKGTTVRIEVPTTNSAGEFA